MLETSAQSEMTFYKSSNRLLKPDHCQDAILGTVHYLKMNPLLPQDVNCDQISVSSMTSVDPECTSLFEEGSVLDPEGFTSSYASPQHDSIACLRRSPARGRLVSQSPTSPCKVFRHNSFSSA